LLLALVGGLVIGTIAPTPLFLQYFCTPVPFLILLAVTASATTVARNPERLASAVRAFAWLAVVSLPYLLISYRSVAQLVELADWIPIVVHRRGSDIAAVAHYRNVLTLAPIFPLEGGAKIYPELATGSFAWRIVPFVDSRSAADLKLLDVNNLLERVSEQPSSLVLLDHEGPLEMPLLQYSQMSRIPVLQLNKTNGFCAGEQYGRSAHLREPRSPTMQLNRNGVERALDAVITQFGDCAKRKPATRPLRSRWSTRSTP
jgi:hypothetical protein